MEKRICRRIFMALMAMTIAIVPCFAAGDPSSFYDVVQPVVDLLDSLLGPLLLVVGAVGALYCVLLGVKYARAEEPQDREKAKAHLKGAIIGFVLIFVLIVVLNLAMPVLRNWAAGYTTSL